MTAHKPGSSFGDPPLSLAQGRGGGVDVVCTVRVQLSTIRCSDILILYLDKELSDPYGEGRFRDCFSLLIPGALEPRGIFLRSQAQRGNS